MGSFFVQENNGCLLSKTNIITLHLCISLRGFFEKGYFLFLTSILFVSLLCLTEVYAEETDELKLYAQSAVLIDGDSGRVLYEKNGEEIRPMASTTKIMTCILALELADVEEMVTVSAKASSMPKVRLGMLEGEKYKLKDLLYSLMLESHNDSAAAIAEHIGGSIEEFADIMNQKARDIGCYSTYFITPNGLDATLKGKDGTELTHETTAKDLARIMQYCIKDSGKREEFLEITRTSTYRFSNGKGTRSFHCANHNAFLTMMEGALTGKTGFTAKAGYCYVGALRQGERTFIVALLGCGWPNNKGYKWSDTKKLMSYGLANYQYQNIDEEIKLSNIPVTDGIPDTNQMFDTAYVKVACEGEEEFPLLLKEGEKIQVKINVPKTLEAPVKKGSVIGNVQYILDDVVLKELPVACENSVLKKNFLWSVEAIGKEFLNLKNVS